MASARSKFSTLKQICTYMPAHLVSKLAREYGVDNQAGNRWKPGTAIYYSGNRTRLHVRVQPVFCCSGSLNLNAHGITLIVD